MKKNKFLKVFSSAVALSVVLAGCSSSSNNSSSTKGAKPKVEFKTSVDNGGNLKEGQTLKYGILSSAPLTGLWNVVFSDQATDQFVNQNVMGGTFPTDAEGRAKLDKEDAPVKMHLDREKNEVTLTIHKDLKWNNGENVTSKDFTKFAEAELNKKPLSYGPYYISKEVNGESVLVEANPHYYQKDKVKTKKVEFKVIAPAQASSVIKSGEVDIIESVTSGVYDSSKDVKNGTFLGESSRYMSYVGFKLGKFDKEKGENVVNPNSKFADKKLRQAFLYAVDCDQINEKVFKGIRFTPTGSGMYPPAIGQLVNENATAIKKDVEKAKKLLDEAGYKDTNGDGIREGKDGKELKFNFAIRNTGQDFDQALADTFIKSWKEVGLNVVLNDGKLMAPKDFSQRVQSDDPSIEIFQGAWQYGTNPNRQELLGKKAPLNLYRYTTDAFEESFKVQATADMFDAKKLKEAYNKFDSEVAEELPFFPLSWDTSITWVNKRVKNYDLNKIKNGEFYLYNIELTDEQGAK